MADTKTDARQAEDKKRLAAEREAREKAARERKRGRPTPTQDEADLAALGHHPELSPDGSEEEKPAGHQTRHMEPASGGGGYQTRQSTPQSNKTGHSSG
jgi:hypothetical protein